MCAGIPRHHRNVPMQDARHSPAMRLHQGPCHVDPPTGRPGAAALRMAWHPRRISMPTLMRAHRAAQTSLLGNLLVRPFEPFWMARWRTVHALFDSRSRFWIMSDSLSPPPPPPPGTRAARDPSFPARFLVHLANASYLHARDALRTPCKSAEDIITSFTGLATWADVVALPAVLPVKLVGWG